MNVKTFVKEITTTSVAIVLLKTSNLAYRTANLEAQYALRTLEAKGPKYLTKGIKSFERAIRLEENADYLRETALQMHPVKSK